MPSSAFDEAIMQTDLAYWKDRAIAAEQALADRATDGNVYLMEENTRLRNLVAQLDEQVAVLRTSNDALRQRADLREGVLDIRQQEVSDLHLAMLRMARGARRVPAGPHTERLIPDPKLMDELRTATKVAQEAENPQPRRTRISDTAARMEDRP